MPSSIEMTCRPAWPHCIIFFPQLQICLWLQESFRVSEISVYIYSVFHSVNEHALMPVVVCWNLDPTVKTVMAERSLTAASHCNRCCNMSVMMLWARVHHLSNAFWFSLPGRHYSVVLSCLFFISNPNRSKGHTPFNVIFLKILSDIMPVAAPCSNPNWNPTET